ncbi:mycobactin polyketide synthase MbtD [Mycobacterium spongiae]|uniref:Mycobactin polyketide synthase MbtD n=1 Tax=Mycobacterium spongiae TaxID=886343 RepID=A0A975JYU3_9MYCO|nr:mycobactin polyketide synthase MbtD [Mycobacterium spongiae]QUR68222.1 mycobactin polyketide synthase MbtD [Mycobacterium spongiae]
MAPKRLPDGRVAVLLSAHAEELIGRDARAIADYLDRFPETTASAVSRQVHKTRRVRTHRVSLRVADRVELIDGLHALAAGRDHHLVARSALGDAPRHAFVFPGQGGQWPGMGAVAYQELPVYRSVTDTCAAAFDAVGTPSPLRYLTAERVADEQAPFAEIEIEGAQFVHAVALAEVWRSCGVHPDVTVGHSLGEVAAAYIAGSITLSDAVGVVCARANVVDRLPGRYAVAALGISEQAARTLIAATEGWLELSVINAPATVAVSGDREAVLAIVETVRASGDFAREITVGFPVHTSVLEPLRDELLSGLPDSEFVEAPVRFIGGTTGDMVPPSTAFREYWYANLRHTVRFDRAVESAIRCGARSFIELSANPVLLFAVRQNLEESAPFREVPTVLVGSGRRDEPFVDSLAANIAAAAVADPGYPWEDLNPGAPDRDTGLSGFPNAPMHAVPLWAHPEPLSPVPGRTPGLTTAVERWNQLASVTPASGPRRHIAVIGLGTQHDLAETFRMAIDSHPGTELSSARDAELTAVIAPEFDYPDAARVTGELCDLVGAGVLDYPSQVGSDCHTVCLVTVGGEQVSSGDAVPFAGQAALAAMHRSIGFEYPERTFSHLDLPSGELAPEAGAALVEALLTGRSEIALRDSASGYVLLGRTLADAPAAAAWPLDAAVLDDVVITGGAGAIGLHYARYFAEHGARRVVLLSRHAADPTVLTELAAHHGTVVVSPPCDITDPDQLSAVAAEYGAAGASLVVHAAGATTFEAAGCLTADAIADTLAAKITGLVRVNELWPIRADARMLLCSSVTGVWGGKSIVSYSAANRLLDVMAAELRAQGRFCVAVKYGVWERPPDGAVSPGMLDAAEMARVERTGLRQMAPRQAISASLRDYWLDPLVFAADAGRLQMFLDTRQAQWRDPGRRTAVVAAPTCADNPTTADVVRSQLAAVLGMAHDGELRLEDSLFDLGVDSMLGVDLSKRLRRVIGRTVPLATLMDDITGDELVERLEGADVCPDTAEKVDVSRD